MAIRSQSTGEGSARHRSPAIAGGGAGPDLPGHSDDLSTSPKAIQGEVGATFEGVCILRSGDRVELRQGFWDRSVLRVASLRNIDMGVTYNSHWPFLRAKNEITPTTGAVSDIVVSNAAEETVTGLLVSFRFKADLA